jgi:hypothetical protein
MISNRKVCLHGHINKQISNWIWCKNHKPNQPTNMAENMAEPGKPTGLLVMVNQTVVAPASPASRPAACAPSRVANVSFAAACEELRACSLRVCEAGRELRRARHAVSNLRRTYRVQLKQELPKTLLQEKIAVRAACKQRLDEKLRALDECMLVVPNCEPKPSDWKKQVAVALVTPRKCSNVSSIEVASVATTEHAGALSTNTMAQAGVSTDSDSRTKTTNW